jgi:hypothetical protein
LFWDIVDEVSLQLDALVAPVEILLAEQSFNFDHSTTIEQFHSLLVGATSVSNLTSGDEKQIYEHVSVYDYHAPPLTSYLAP